MSERVSEQEAAIGRPSRLLTLSEPLRGSLELGGLPAAMPWLATAPRGDARPVMVLPGFGTTDTSTAVLRSYLNLMNYRALPWEQGRNVGMRQVGESLDNRLHEIFDSYEGKPISLVGWSLGGVIARELARRHPNKVRDVISLGSPISGSYQYTAMAPALDQARRMRGMPQRQVRSVIFSPPDVPCTAIFSRADGVVPAGIAQEAPYPNCENIEVVSSHMGMGVNAAVFWAVADRLAAPTAERSPFKAPLLLRSFYPR